MHILLTGGAGFIGHHLIGHFLAKGEKVVAVDNLSTGRKSNLATYIHNPNFKFIECDARDQKTIEPLIANASVIYNLAASVGVQKIFQDPIECIENNTETGSLILKLASKYNRRIFIFSTSEIYGKTEKFPFDENSNITIGSCDKLRWSYACSKVLDDYLARAYFEKKQLPVTMVRLFNTIGINQVGQYGMVVPRLMTQAIQNKTLTVYGNGAQTRCFTDIRDVVTALDILIDNKQSVGELINLGTDNEISILSLAQKIIQLTGSSSKIEMVSYEDAYGAGFEDMDRRVASSKKLKLLTGFEFTYRLDDTLRWIYNDMIQDIQVNNNSQHHATS